MSTGPFKISVIGCKKTLRDGCMAAAGYFNTRLRLAAVFSGLVIARERAGPSPP